MNVEFVEVESHRSTQGKLLHTFEGRLAIDVRAILPNRGDEIQIPGSRADRMVTSVKFQYGQKGLLRIKVWVLSPARTREVRKWRRAS